MWRIGKNNEYQLQDKKKFQNSIFFYWSQCGLCSDLNRSTKYLTVSTLVKIIKSHNPKPNLTEK